LKATIRVLLWFSMETNFAFTPCIMKYGCIIQSNNHEVFVSSGNPGKKDWTIIIKL
jgi:hypothetical protein